MGEKVRPLNRMNLDNELICFDLTANCSNILTGLCC